MIKTPAIAIDHCPCISATPEQNDTPDFRRPRLHPTRIVPSATSAITPALLGQDMCVHGARWTRRSSIRRGWSINPAGELARLAGGTPALSTVGQHTFINKKSVLRVLLVSACRYRRSPPWLQYEDRRHLRDYNAMIASFFSPEADEAERTGNLHQTGDGVWHVSRQSILTRFGSRRRGAASTSTA